MEIRRNRTRHYMISIMDWCGPCKMVALVLEELSNEYAGKLVIYKVDTEKSMELAPF